MERTEFREEFFKELKSDPYMNYVTRYVALMWTMGYDQALRDNNLYDKLYEKPFDDRLDDAMEFVTESRRKALAEATICLAQLGKLGLNIDG